MMDPRIVANSILDRAERRGREVTNLDLQKLVYFVHGHHLVSKGAPLVSGEFEAWSYGPVHKVLYDALKHFGDTPVAGRLSAFDPVRQVRVTLPALDDPDALAVLDAVVDHYLDLPTFLLVDMTHAPGTPWAEVVRASTERINVGMRIPNDLIERRFEGSAAAPAGR